MPREKFTEDDDDRIRKGVAEFKHHGSLRPQREFLCYFCEKFKMTLRTPNPCQLTWGASPCPRRRYRARRAAARVKQA